MITKGIKRPEHQRIIWSCNCIESHWFWFLPYSLPLHKNLNTHKGSSNSDTCSNQSQSICATRLHHKTSGTLCSGRTTSRSTGDGEAVGICGGEDPCGWRSLGSTLRAADSRTIEARRISGTTWPICGTIGLTFRVAGAGIRAARDLRLATEVRDSLGVLGQIGSGAVVANTGEEEIVWEALVLCSRLVLVTTQKRAGSSLGSAPLSSNSLRNSGDIERRICLGRHRQDRAGSNKSGKNEWLHFEFRYLFVCLLQGELSTREKKRYCNYCEGRNIK